MQPDGYMTNAQGHLVPVAQVREIDKLKDELVTAVVTRAEETQALLRQLKAQILADVDAFVALSGERYGVSLGGKKGNVTLLSYDGRYKLVRARQDALVFDEGLLAAKTLIDECLREWTRESRSELRALVEQAFKMNREGRINKSAILALRQLEINDERWQRAMRAIGDSLQVLDTATYIRLYERDANGRYNPIALDIAAL